MFGMHVPMIIADWNGHLIPFFVATPLAAIGCLLLLVAAILAVSKREDEKKTGKKFVVIGASLLTLAALVAVFGKDSVS